MSASAGPSGVHYGTPAQGSQPPQGGSNAEENQPAKVFRRHDPKISVKHGGRRPTGLKGINADLTKSGPEELSRHDQALHDAFWDKRRAEAEAAVNAGEKPRLIMRLQLLANSGAQGIVYGCNGKSTSKTRSLQTAAAAVKRYTGRGVDQMSATENISTVTLGLMSDLLPEEIRSVVEFNKGINEVHTFKQIRALIPLTKNDFVGIIGEGESDANTVKSYGTNQFVQNTLALVPNTEYLFLDGGNGDIRQGSIPLWAARLAHVLMFVYEPGNAAATTTFRQDVRGYRTDCDSGPQLDAESKAFLAEIKVPNLDVALSLTGVNIPTPIKVAQSVVVAAKADRPDHEQITAYMRPAGDASSNGAPPWQGRSASIGTDSWFAGKQKDDRPNPCIWDKLDESTQFDGIALAVALLEQLAIALGLNVPDTYKERPPIVIDES